MTYYEATRKLAALGCAEIPRRRGTSHRSWLNPEKQVLASLLNWGGRDLKLGTKNPLHMRVFRRWSRK